MTAADIPLRNVLPRLGLLAATYNASNADSAWHEVGGSGEPGWWAAEGTDWQNTGAGTEGARFYRDELGWVHVRGNVKKTDNPTGIFGSGVFALPAGYRPPSTILLPIQHAALQSGAWGGFLGAVWGGGWGALGGLITWAGPVGAPVTECQLIIDFPAEV